MKPSWHYYEAHINLGKMPHWLDDYLPTVLRMVGFETTDIVNNPQPDLEQEDFYRIITTKDINLNTLTIRINSTVKYLKSLGYPVQRYKIESTIIDSKYDDKLGLLQ